MMAQRSPALFYKPAHGRGSGHDRGRAGEPAATAAAKQNPRQKPLVITIAADAKYYIRNEARNLTRFDATQHNASD